MLSQSILKSSLDRLFSDPFSHDDKNLIAGVWADLYHKYSSTVIAGVMVPVLNPLLIKNGILSHANDFFRGLNSGITAYWLGSTWAGPGFVGKIAAVPPFLDPLLSLSRSLNDVSPSEASSRFSSFLHTYSSSLIVLGTNVATGIVTPLAVA